MTFITTTVVWPLNLTDKPVKEPHLLSSKKYYCTGVVDLTTKALGRTKNYYGHLFLLIDFQLSWEMEADNHRGKNPLHPRVKRICNLNYNSNDFQHIHSFYYIWRPCIYNKVKNIAFTKTLFTIHFSMVTVTDQKSFQWHCSQIRKSF